MQENKMKALVLDAENQTAQVQNISIPVPASNELLIEVKAIALNPVDPLYVAHPLGKSGRIVGSDFAGVITALGSSVPQSSNLKPGDRVSGFLQGACSVNDRPGAFAEYLTVEWDLVWKIPDGVNTEEAAGVTLVALTAAQGIWYRLGLPAPFAFTGDKEFDHSRRKEDPEVINFLVYGASTSVGLYAAQVVRLSAEASGKHVKLFGVASKANWDMLKAAPYGYTHLVDYKDQDWPEQILKLSDGTGMHYAYDAISEGDTVAQVSSTLNGHGTVGVVRSRAAGAWKPEKVTVEPVYGAAWEGLGKEVQYTWFTIKESPEARTFAVEFYKWLGKAIGDCLKANPIRLMPGGLERVVEDGFSVLGKGTMYKRIRNRDEEWMRPISAEKLVYKL